MANVLRVIVQRCGCVDPKQCLNQTIIVDDIDSELFVGGVFSFSGTPGSTRPIAYGCYEVISLDPAQAPVDTVIVSEYTDCATCLVEASNALQFNICSGKRNTVYLPKTSFLPLPTVGDVFFLDVYIDNFEGGYARITSCFTFKGFVFIGSSFLNDYGLVSATPYVDCPTCLSGSPIVYSVSECVSGDIYYIAFPSNLYQNHLVTFTGLDGITQFCGIVKEEVVNTATTGLLVADLGIVEKFSNDCETCLANVAEKKKLVNCLDDEDIIIAWASQLFEAGDVTNISINNSCYLISPDPVDPEEPVTAPEFANFDPHQQCENCFECHGLTYDFSSCTEVTVCGELSKYTFSETGGYSLITDNNIAYLGFRNSGIVSKFDMSTNTILASYSGFGTQPGKLGFDSTNKILAIPDINTPFTRFIDTNTNVGTGTTTTSAAQRPVSAYFNPNDNYFYVGVQNLTGNSIVNIYDASAFPSISLVNSITITELNVSNIEVIQVGVNLFITAGNSVYVYDATTYSIITIPILGYTISSITYSPTTNKIFVVGQNNGVTSIDPVSFAFLTSINLFPVCCANGFVFYDVTSNKLFVTFSNVNNLFEVNENDLTLSNTLNINSSSQPNGIGVYNGDTYVLMDDTLVRLGCGSEFLEASINSYEYVPIGDSFYHPIYDICCTVTNIRTDMDGDFTFYSLKSYSGCSDCNAVSYEVFTAIGCDIPVTGLVVAEAGQHSIGDIVRSHWGNSDFLCFEIDGTYTIGDVAEGYNFETENQPSFTSCTECTLGATVGLTLINCRTLVESYVNVSLDTWSTISGLNSLPSPSVCDAQGNCYVVVNSCPIDNVYEEFTPTNFYFDCTLCRVDNPNFQARSANTETLVCVTCCPCDGTSGSTFSVIPPHPVWTDGYGTEVTQLNMITLGGINGLNG